MPTAKRVKGKTINVADFTQAEVAALAMGALELPDTSAKARHAAAWLTFAPDSKDANMAKAPRESMQALADELREHFTSLAKMDADLAPALEKLERRLARKSRGPLPDADMWAIRAELVKHAFQLLEDRRDNPPIDADVERVMSVAANTLSRWRARKPRLFRR